MTSTAEDPARGEDQAGHAPCTVPGVDLLDGSRFVAGAEHEMFDALREQEPVSWHRLPDGSGFWSVVRHDDVATVNREWERFTIKGGSIIGERDGFLGLGDEVLTLAADPPLHTQMRLIVNRGFTPRAVDRLDDEIVTIVHKTLDEAEAAAAGDVVDFVPEVGKLPARVVGAILGVPEEDRDQLGEWTSHITAGGSKDDDVPDLGEAGNALFGYALELAADASRRSGADLVSKLVEAEVDGRALTPVELAIFFLILYTAGTETTRVAASVGTLALLEHPDEWTRLRSGDVATGSAVDEIVRWSTPVAYFQRHVRADTELRGVPLQAGDPVVMWFSAANRDPDVFDDPHRFDLGRDPNPHVGFGAGGPHYCLGVHLARSELGHLFEALTTRYPDLALAGDAAWVPSNFTPGLASLPVSLGRRQADAP
jgi:cholest-4-en-3-one 26-monooxygenase